MAYNYEYPYTDLSRYNNDWLINKVKEVVAEWASTKSDWNDVKNDWDLVKLEWNSLKEYVDNYFETLDVTVEVNARVSVILNQYLNDGTLIEIVEPYIPGLVTTWLSQHMTNPSSVAIDTSLSIAGAVADSGAVGVAISKIKTSLGDYEPVSYTGAILQNTGRVVQLDGITAINVNFNTSDYIAYNTNLNILTINSCGLNNAAVVAFYENNDQNTFISAISAPVAISTPTAYNIPPNAKYIRFSNRINTTFNVTLSAKDIMSTMQKEIISVNDDIKYNLNAISRLISNDFGGAIIHISIDDVWDTLKRLASPTLTSIFDIPLLNSLKAIHDNTGACFTLNCFNTISTDANYNVSNVSNLYRAEFVASKKWLKFSFHAENDDANYNNSTGILNAYNNFVSAIYTLTGDYECIDRVARLGYFGGSLENVLLIKNTSYGILGLLCADDARDSYYLNPAQNLTIREKGKLYDFVNDLFFCRTLKRSDTNGSAVVISQISDNILYQKFSEVFLHEASWIANISSFETSISNIMNWANSNGFKSNYIMNVIK